MQTTTTAAQLVALSPAVIGSAFDIGDAEITIGRNDACTITISHPLVSRTHARVARIGDQYILFDAGSTNGTFLNSQRLLTHQTLRHGDEIGVADATPLLKFVDPDSTRARPDALRLDIETQTFFLHDRALPLSQMEFRLLLHLRSNAGRICSRESCVFALWRTKTGVDAFRNPLDQHIYQIRSKLQAVDPRANLIRTVRGDGYMLEG
jgi:hypothetical protein